MTNRTNLDPVFSTIASALPGGEDGHVTRLLRGALAGDPVVGTPHWESALARLASRVHIARTLHADYGPDWRGAPDGPDPLGPAWSAAAAAAFVRFAEELPDGDDALGLRLKALNAAFAALDLCGTSVPKDALAELSAFAEESLAAAMTNR